VLWGSGPNQHGHLGRGGQLWVAAGAVSVKYCKTLTFPHSSCAWGRARCRGAPAVRRWPSLTALVALVALGCAAPAGLSLVAVPTAGTASQAAAAEPHASPAPEAAEAALPTPNPVVRDVWRSAAQASNWEAVALKIDALPQLDQAEPGTRYVRALAASRLSDCERALRALDGLAEALPLLKAEIDALRAECQLTVGPVDATTGGPMHQVSLEGRLDAAVSWERAGQLERAQALVEGVVLETSDSEASVAIARSTTSTCGHERCAPAWRSGSDSWTWRAATTCG
jgi:hypothetical protein